MKYIRTKDGHIYCHPDFGPRLAKVGIGLPTEVYLDVIYKMRHFQVKEQDVIDQADTIDELCDEFVWVNHKTNTRAFEGQSLEQVKEYYLQQCDKELWDFYGAIWTDKGLIYVAKMNEKGEFELL